MEELHFEMECCGLEGSKSSCTSRKQFLEPLKRELYGASNQGTTMRGVPFRTRSGTLDYNLSNSPSSEPFRSRTWTSDASSGTSFRTHPVISSPSQIQTNRRDEYAYCDLSSSAPSSQHRDEDSFEYQISNPGSYAERLSIPEYCTADEILQISKQGQAGDLKTFPSSTSEQKIGFSRKLRKSFSRLLPRSRSKHSGSELDAEMVQSQDLDQSLEDILYTKQCVTDSVLKGLPIIPFGAPGAPGAHGPHGVDEVSVVPGGPGEDDVSLNPRVDGEVEEYEKSGELKLNPETTSGDQMMKSEVEELTPALRRDSSPLSSSLKSQHLYTPSPTLGRPTTLIPSSPLLVIDSQTDPTLGRPTALIPSAHLLVIDSQTEPTALIPSPHLLVVDSQTEHYTSQAPGFNIYQSYPNKIPGIRDNKPEPNPESNYYTSQSLPEDPSLNLHDEYCLMEPKQDYKPKSDLMENKQFKSESNNQDYILQDQVKLAKDQNDILQDQVKLAKDQDYTLQDQVKLARDQEYTLQDQVTLAKDQDYTLQDQVKLAKDQEYTLQDQVKLAKDQEYTLQDQVKLDKDQEYILQDQVKLSKDQDYKIAEDKTEDVYNITNNVSKMVIDEYYVMDLSLPENEDYCIMETTTKNKMKKRKNPEEYCLMEKKSQGMNLILPQSDNTKPTDENQEYCTMFPKSVPTKPNHLNLSGRQTKSSKLGLTLFTGTSVPQGPSFQSNLSPISSQPCKLDRGTGDEAGLQFEYSRSGSPARSYLENRRVSFSPDSEPKSRSRVDLQDNADQVEYNENYSTSRSRRSNSGTEEPETAYKKLSYLQRITQENLVAKKFKKANKHRADYNLLDFSTLRKEKRHVSESYSVESNDSKGICSESNSSQNGSEKTNNVDIKRKSTKKPFFSF